MYGSLLLQQWKQTIRSSYFKQGIGVKILLAFLILYFGASFLILGVFLPELLGDIYPDANLLTPIFMGFLLYYFLADICMRFFLQDLSVLSIQHYLVLPIKKTKIIHFLLRGSVFNFFNLLPLFVIVPFTLKVVAPEYGAVYSVFWLVSLLFLVIANHFLAIYMKRILAVKQSVFIGLAVLIGLAFTGDFLGWFSLQNVSSIILSPLAENPILALVPLMLATGAYFLNFNFLKTHTQLDLWQNKKGGDKINTKRFSFIESKGILGGMLANELKLITRNKRTKTILFVTILFMGYGLIFYSDDSYAGLDTMFLAIGILMTGIFMINYGQFIIGWEGAYFDGILTRSNSIDDFFKAKFLLLTVSCVITYVLTIPYVYFGLDALYANTAGFIFNLGFNSFFLLFASTYNKKKIDLSKGNAFNYQGTSAVQFLITLPLIGLPILIFLSFDVFFDKYVGFIAVASFGLLSLACSKLWFKIITDNFKEKKYINAEGFRAKS